MTILTIHTPSDVIRWQKIVGATPDGVWGFRSDLALRAWQTSHGLTPDGIVGPACEAALKFLVPPNPAGYPFIQAKGFNRGRGAPVKLVVIHTMECQEQHGKARWCAEWFADKYAPTYPAPQASAHYLVDDTEVVQGVLETDTAWHAGSVNPFSIGVEHAGWAKQSPTDWTDPFSTAELALSAKLVAGICKRWGIQIRRPSLADLANGAGGVCGHVDITNAFGHGAGHVDPGPNFPWFDYLNLTAEEWCKL